jgi:hypothetical protein
MPIRRRTMVVVLAAGCPRKLEVRRIGGSGAPVGYLRADATEFLDVVVALAALAAPAS